MNRRVALGRFVFRQQFLQTFEIDANDAFDRMQPIEHQLQIVGDAQLIAREKIQRTIVDMYQALVDDVQIVVNANESMEFRAIDVDVRFRCIDRLQRVVQRFEMVQLRGDLQHGIVNVLGLNEIRLEEKK